MQGAAESPERSTASFMLQLGLRSFAGGNLDAALHRLGACEQQLRAMLPGSATRADAAEGATEAVDEQLSIQLGAVCGSLGDCHRRLGDAEKAKQRYQDSVAQLQRCATPNDEVRSKVSSDSDSQLCVTKPSLGINVAICSMPLTQEFGSCVRMPWILCC